MSLFSLHVPLLATVRGHAARGPGPRSAPRHHRKAGEGDRERDGVCTAVGVQVVPRGVGPTALSQGHQTGQIPRL